MPWGFSLGSRHCFRQSVPRDSRGTVPSPSEVLTPSSRCVLQMNIASNHTSHMRDKSSLPITLNLWTHLPLIVEIWWNSMRKEIVRPHCTSVASMLSLKGVSSGEGSRSPEAPSLATSNACSKKICIHQKVADRYSSFAILSQASAICMQMVTCRTHLAGLIVFKLVGSLSGDSDSIDAEHFQRGCLWQGTVQRVEMKLWVIAFWSTPAAGCMSSAQSNLLIRDPLWLSRNLFAIIVKRTLSMEASMMSYPTWKWLCKLRAAEGLVGSRPMASRFRPDRQTEEIPADLCSSWLTAAHFSTFFLKRGPEALRSRARLAFTSRSTMSCILAFSIYCIYSKVWWDCFLAILPFIIATMQGKG